MVSEKGTKHWTTATDEMDIAVKLLRYDLVFVEMGDEGTYLYQKAGEDTFDIVMAAGDGLELRGNCDILKTEGNMGQIIAALSEHYHLNPDPRPAPAAPV